MHDTRDRAFGGTVLIEYLDATTEILVERARAVSTYNEDQAAELRRVQVEEDLSSEDVTRTYIQGGQSALKELLAAHAGSEDSKARLAIRLEAVHPGV